MLDGNYAIWVDTLLGPQQGSVNLYTKDAATYADIDAPVIGRQFIEVRAEGNTFAAEGTFRLLLLGKIKYDLRGEVEGDNVHIVIESNKGNFNIGGTRVLQQQNAFGAAQGFSNLW